MTDCQEKRKKGVDWYNPPCFTHLLSYKMCVNECTCCHPIRSCMSTPACSVVSMMLIWSGPSEGRCWCSYSTSFQLIHYDYVFDYSKACDDQCQRVISGEISSNKSPFTPRLPPHAPPWNITQTRNASTWKMTTLNLKYLQKIYNYVLKHSFIAFFKLSTFLNKLRLIKSVWSNY